MIRTLDDDWPPFGVTRSEPCCNFHPRGSERETRISRCPRGANRRVQSASSLTSGRRVARQENIDEWTRSKAKTAERRWGVIALLDNDARDAEIIKDKLTVVKLAGCATNCQPGSEFVYPGTNDTEDLRSSFVRFVLTDRVSNHQPVRRSSNRRRSTRSVEHVWRSLHTESPNSFESLHVMYD